MNLLLTNAVPLNGGDEALLRAAIESLARHIPQCNITILCKDVETARRLLPDLTLESDLEFAPEESFTRTAKLYQDADIVLSAPGGFLHDHYSIEERLRGFEFSLALGKPVVLLGQSIGPFWKRESMRRIPQVLNRVSRICVRDAISREHLLKLGVADHIIQETADMAFLWHRLVPGLFRLKTGPVKKIGLCFRRWPLGEPQAASEILTKAEQLCRMLLADPARELVFCSTCQGVSGYPDDSTLAMQLIERLPPDLRVRCQINRARLTPAALIRSFGECDAFIGMRLHGCLLSMLGGTPAMGLGYETKTREIFRQMGYERFQIPFDSDFPAWRACVEQFLQHVPAIRTNLAFRLEQLCDRAELNLAAVTGTRTPPASVILETEPLLVLARKHVTGGRKFAEMIEPLIPPGSRFILVDDQQCSGQFPGWDALPFLEKNGVYWGPSPDSATAVSELERLRRQGAGFIVFAAPSFWWLEHYPDFAQHLRTSFPCLLENGQLTMFDLR